MTGWHPEQFPRNAEHDKQRANTRRGLDALVEDWCYEAHLPFSHAARPDVIITSGEKHSWGFDHYLRTTRGLRLGTPGQVKNRLRDEWDTQHFHSSINGTFCTGVMMPTLADLRSAFEAKHNSGRSMDWRSDAKQWESSDDKIPF